MGDKSGMSSNKGGLMQTGNCTITWSAFSTTWTPFYCVFNQTFHSKARKIKPKPPKYVHQQEQMSEWAAKWLMNSESQTKTSCCSLLFHCVVTTKDSQLQSNESEDTERLVLTLFLCNFKSNIFHTAISFLLHSFCEQTKVLIGCCWLWICEIKFHLGINISWFRNWVGSKGTLHITYLFNFWAWQKMSSAFQAQVPVITSS